MKIQKNQKTIVVLGASDKPERYSNKAIRFLDEKGYSIIPVHPLLKEIEGHAVTAQLSMIDEPVHTLTVYLQPALAEQEIPAILALQPQRVILNPGTESSKIKEACEKNNIPVLEACTLVLLRTGQFDPASSQIN